MQERSRSPPPDYKTFADNVTFTLDRVMETLTIVSERLEAREQRKPSPAPSESGNSGHKPRVEVHEEHDEDSKASKPSCNGLADRMLERKIKSSEVLEDLASRKDEARRRLHFDEDSEDDHSIRSKSRIEELLDTKPKKTWKDLQRIKV